MIWSLNGFVQMKNKKKERKCINQADALFCTTRKLKAGLLLLVTGIVFQLLARNAEGFAQWYASSVYLLLVTIIGRVSVLVPFSIVEFLLYGLVIALIGGLFRGLYQIRKKRKKSTDVLLHWAACLCLLCGSLFFVYTMTCGINYHRTSFSESAGIQTEKYSQEELVEAAEYLTEKVNELAGRVPRTRKGLFVLEGDTKRQAVEAMEKLANRYPVLEGYYPLPKPVMVSQILSYQHLTGVYSPFTIEANYNSDMTAYNIPFTMCHELSHLRGFMSEDEANFIAYLSCMESEEESFQYSGALLGWIYVTNALYSEDAEKYSEIRDKMDNRALLDLQQNNAFWDKYDGAVAEVADKVNDVYLKANRQLDGVKSYGKVVDLILAYRKSISG